MVDPDRQICVRACASRTVCLFFKTLKKFVVIADGLDRVLYPVLYAHINTYNKGFLLSGVEDVCVHQSIDTTPREQPTYCCFCQDITLTFGSLFSELGLPRQFKVVRVVTGCDLSTGSMSTKTLKLYFMPIKNFMKYNLRVLVCMVLKRWAGLVWLFGIKRKETFHSSNIIISFIVMDVRYFNKFFGF